MPSLRQQVLQEELDRIEAEAANRSRLIMGSADTLAAAREFCDRINEGLPLSPNRRCHAIVIYHSASCEILLCLHPDGERDFVRRCHELGVSLSVIYRVDMGCRMSIDSLPGVTFFLSFIPEGR
jgi:hypothetical protein